ncbi:VIT domain-containing protein [Streptosporangium sp. NPDC049046]|uniref:VIT domain-containing protein n=1 Tax=Streptosporangium sp. NPDC049046 TaxID=3155031 RepID=UPI0034151B11
MITSITTLPPEECHPVPDTGLGALATELGNLPLESVDVTAAVSGLSAGVEVVQGFRNPHDVALEATYVFPLPDRAAVTAFRMEADGRVIEGVLKERGQARADYDQAISQGKRAAIAEEDRPDVFTMRVGNIVPGERVTVHLTLNQPLPYEDGAATFRFPLVVAPRYIPGTPLDGERAGDGWAPDTDAVPDASRITPPVLLPGFPNPVRLSLAVSVDPAGLELREVRSSLHVVQEEGGVIRLQPGERLDRDFILRLATGASTSLALAPEENDEENGPENDEGTFTLTVVPEPAPARARPKDVVLVLDRSGSMTGWKMVAARRAAARIVDTLTSGDRFAVLSFDSVVEYPEGLGEGLSEASDRNRYRAVEHLARLEARGGTEMLSPLERAAELLADSARDRVLVLVTDGQVGNEDQILARTGAALAGVRVHTVGIDRAVNAGFLGRLAGVGGGRCELVESEDRLDEAMEHIHRRIGAPLVTDLSIEADGIDLITETVSHIGSVYSGVPLTVLGRYRGPAEGAITVRGVGADGSPWERRVTASVVHNPAVRAIWARARLRALEDRYAAGDRSLEAEIVETSLRYGVLCRFTAFVAVDTQVVAEGGPGHRVIQPVEPPSGWENPIAAAPMMMTSMAFENAAAPPPPAPTGPPGMARPGSMPRFAASPAVGGMPHEAAAGGFDDRARMLRPAPAGAAPKRGKSQGAPQDPPKEQLAEELKRLRAAASLPAAERLLLLEDLGSRLAALVVYLGGHAELAALASELQAGGDVDVLWRRAVEVLESLTGSTGRRPFWKR